MSHTEDNTFVDISFHVYYRLFWTYLSHTLHVNSCASEEQKYLKRKSMQILHKILTGQNLMYNQHHQWTHIHICVLRFCLTDLLFNTWPGPQKKTFGFNLQQFSHARCPSYHRNNNVKTQNGIKSTEFNQEKLPTDLILSCSINCLLGNRYCTLCACPLTPILGNSAVKQTKSISISSS